MAKIQEESDYKGGGYRGGPKRWAGNGPAPARHIPWPELFKHHQSVLTGHLKMMDMVRKHCVEGTGNYETANACVNRTQDMLREFKRVSMSFVPPKDNFERVPVGVSSASMYPGYSPADHVYGEAAQEFGTQVSEMKKTGVDWKPPTKGPEYTVGQRAVSEQKQMEEYRKRKAEESGGDSEAEKPTQSTPVSGGEPMEGVETENAGEKPLFFIDTEPTAVAGINGTNSSMKEKRKVSFASTEEIASSEDIPHKKKKFKSKASEDAPAEGIADESVAQDDISAEVEARLKSKEEKRRQKKEEKKRKRESGSSATVQDESVADATAAAAEEGANGANAAEKPKKKKKHDQQAEAEAPVEVESKKEKKHKKKRDSDAVPEESKDVNVDEGEKRKKKRKKDHA